MKLPPELFNFNLTPPEFKVLATICHLSDETGELRARMTDLAPYAGMQREAVRRSLRRLEDVGAVETTRDLIGAGRYGANRYQVLFPVNVGGEDA